MITKCPVCSQQLEIADPQQPKISNLASCSIAVVEHPEPSVCTCGAAFVPGIAAIQRVVFAPLEVKIEKPPLIVVPR